MEDKYRYPIGQQDFKTLRKDNALYVDKTAFIWKIVKSSSKFYFLARPRRFGKSLFLSSLRYFFEGQRDLFKGLYIDSTDWDWEPYPVLHLDLNTDRYASKGILDSVLNNLFKGWEKKYGIDEIESEYSQRFKNIIEAAHRKTGKQVVILVDEYDKPLVSNLNIDTNFEHYRVKLASLYSNFKSASEHIRLVFLTGVSRFSKLSVFSDLNNLQDISFYDDFADVCGITGQELLHNFKVGIQRFAAKRKVGFEQTLKMLKHNYDGYRFSPEGSDIYNPWSVLNALFESRLGAYWIATGATSVVAEALKTANVEIEETLNASWHIQDLMGLDLRNADPTALLYQTGYITIDRYDFDRDTVRLKVPNAEIRGGLYKDLLKLYVKPKYDTTRRIIDGIVGSVHEGNPEKLMKDLEAFFAGIPYDLKMENENNFHNAFYVLLSLIGINTKAEVHTSDGSIDLLIETAKNIFIIELKYDSSPEVALRQIEEKGYARKFETDSRKIIKIGVNFSSRLRRIEGWEIG